MKMFLTYVFKSPFGSIAPAIAEYTQLRWNRAMKKLSARSLESMIRKSDDRAEIVSLNREYANTNGEIYDVSQQIKTYWTRHVQLLNCMKNKKSNFVSYMQKTLIKEKFNDVDAYCTLNRDLSDAGQEYFDKFQAIHGYGLTGQPVSGACIHLCYKTAEELDARGEHVDLVVRCTCLNNDIENKCNARTHCKYKRKNHACHKAWLKHTQLQAQVDNFWSDKVKQL